MLFSRLFSCRSSICRPGLALWPGLNRAREYQGIPKGCAEQPDYFRSGGKTQGQQPVQGQSIPMDSTDYAVGLGC